MAELPGFDETMPCVEVDPFGAPSAESSTLSPLDEAAEPSSPETPSPLEKSLKPRRPEQPDDHSVAPINVQNAVLENRSIQNLARIERIRPDPSDRSTPRKAQERLR